jgi:hypothetical protein
MFIFLGELYILISIITKIVILVHWFPNIIDRFLIFSHSRSVSYPLVDISLGDFRRLCSKAIAKIMHEWYTVLFLDLALQFHSKQFLEHFTQILFGCSRNKAIKEVNTFISTFLILLSIYICTVYICLDLRRQK